MNLCAGSFIYGFSFIIIGYLFNKYSGDNKSKVAILLLPILFLIAVFSLILIKYISLQVLHLRNLKLKDGNTLNITGEVTDESRNMVIIDDDGHGNSQMTKSNFQFKINLSEGAMNGSKTLLKRQQLLIHGPGLTCLQEFTGSCRR